MQQMYNMFISKIVFAFFLATLAGCASVPVEVAQLHQKELSMIKTLEASHKNIVTAYFDSRISEFEGFYFKQYAPRYLENYKEAWENQNGKKYDYEQNFPSFYESSIAVYQSEIQPLYTLRNKLLTSIDDEYSKLITSHQAIDTWLKSVNDLNDADKKAINNILDGAIPGLSIDSIKGEVDNVINGIKAKLFK
ncbi:hypothetical protein [Methylomonas albis]|uniref:DUF2959 domain-containing protein n=1 Tax=Methylomonas albis TaxID=1854563 RepID=A0ABR9D663_9GAMM|nr:hypothetical protein [Methylomonas albis]MBD9358618.1 hypothetical protein [Methylomonas albis]